MQNLRHKEPWWWRAGLAALTIAVAAAASLWLPADPGNAGTHAEWAGALSASLPPDGAPRLRHSHLGTIDRADWDLFKRRFIRNDGQLIDSHSQLSHSEGQGYAMILAVAADDRPAFDRAWDWTRHNLQHDDDALLAWKWRPDARGGAVGDRNDAADGDILVAWALHRAARRWHDPDYDRAAKPMARDILHKLVRDIGGYAVLLPGEHGFVHGDTVTVNLSYWIFPAFRSLNELEPSLRWYQLERGGRYLIEEARFGQLRLPSDWVALRADPTVGLAVDLLPDQPLSGFDAIRIPLYLMWDGQTAPGEVAPFLSFWRDTTTGKIPATVNLATGATASYPMLPGMRAIVIATESRLSGPGAGLFTPTLPALDHDHDYYSVALGLLVRLALNETS